MRKRIFLRLFLFLVFVVIIIVIALNINVSTKQGINYEVHTIRIPLFLKVIDFIDRHYNYKQLVNRIIKNEDNEEERIMKIFTWTYQNIKKQPETLPIIDDHAWHIIVRGYGVDDQFSDVFTTLCNYNGIDAFFGFIFKKDRTANIPLSFIKLNKRYYVFDPYNGVYFKNDNGTFADIKEIKSGNGRLQYIGEVRSKVDYKIYIDNIPYNDIEKICLERSQIQSPLRRIMFETKNCMKKIGLISKI